MPEVQDSVETQAPVRIALWGVGKVYREHIDLLIEMQERGQIELVAVADATPPAETLNGIPVVTPDELASARFDYLLIMSLRFARAMIDEATAHLGIPRSKIRTCTLLYVPYLDFRSYKRLCDSRISIVSNTRWGGLAYGMLQMERLSPFVETQFKEQDYLRLLGSLEEYMAVDDLTFRERRFDSSGKPYLSFDWGDIELRIGQDADPEIALEQWLARRASFNWSNVFVQMSTVNPEAERAFEAMDRFPKRVCFVPFATDCRHSIQLSILPQHRTFRSAVSGATVGEGRLAEFSLTELLLGSDIAEVSHGSG